MSDAIASVHNLYKSLRTLNVKSCVPDLSEGVVYANSPWPEAKGTGAFVDALAPLFGAFSSWDVTETKHEATTPDGRTALNERIETFTIPGGAAKLRIFGAFDFDESGKCTRWHDVWDQKEFADGMAANGFAGAIPPSSPDAYIAPASLVQADAAGANDAIVRKFMQSWSARAEEFAPYLADDIEYINMPMPPNHGKDAAAAFLSGFLGAAEGFEVIVHKSAETTSGVVLNERTDRFKFDGQWIGFAVCGVFELDNAGKITHWRDYFDLGVFAQRLGAVKPELLAALG